ncbi:MAG: hypothetical protein LLG93_13560 [Deltaproteobacteria bacterium]|nr:hypothetical protein [Deltaproteobacteria bacterium]
MTRPLDELLGLVASAVGPLPTQRGIRAYRKTVRYPALTTTTKLNGVTLEDFITVPMQAPPEVAADVYEDFIAQYLIASAETPRQSPREFLQLNLGLTPRVAHWLFPGRLPGIHLLIRLAWAIAKASGDALTMTHDTLQVGEFPIGVRGGKVLSHWFAGRVPDFAGDVTNVIQAPHNRHIKLGTYAHQLLVAARGTPELLEPVGEALAILALGYGKNERLEQVFLNDSPHRRGRRRALREVAAGLLMYTGNPGPAIFKELVGHGYVTFDELSLALPRFRTYYTTSIERDVPLTLRKQWAQALRKLGG